jgi:nitroreductase
MTHDPAKGALPLHAGKRAETIEEALLSRRSLRAFRPDPVPRETVERILALASRAPSGTNVQPWKVHVAAGAVRDRIAAEMTAEFMAHGEEGWAATYAYYPTKWREPYLGRRRKLGWDLYGLLGIGKGDRERTKAQHARNFHFFDAPVALFFVIDEDLEKGSWLDYGMFLQSVMLAARAFGLDTCPQAAIARAHEVLRRHLPIAANEVVVCGMSLGYARDDAVENSLVTEREPVAGFASFHGF